MSWRVFWALVLIALGVIPLLINLGILPGSAWNFIFPERHPTGWRFVFPAK